VITYGEMLTFYAMFASAPWLIPVPVLTRSSSYGGSRDTIPSAIARRSRGLRNEIIVATTSQASFSMISRLITDRRELALEKPMRTQWRPHGATLSQQPGTVQPCHTDMREG